MTVSSHARQHIVQHTRVQIFEGPPTISGLCVMKRYMRGTEPTALVAHDSCVHMAFRGRAFIMVTGWDVVTHGAGSGRVYSVHSGHAARHSVSAQSATLIDV